MADEQRVGTVLLLRAVLLFVVFFTILGVALFLPAGDIRWQDGWLFIGVFSALTTVALFYLWYANPEIFVARRGFHPGTKRWDQVVVSLLFASFLAIFPTAGFDVGRFHWSKVPLGVMVLGYILFCVGYFISIWVYRVNKFAEPGVRIQTERGHKVIDTGPYAVVRHPLYLGALLMCAGIPLSLGSLWALLPGAAGAVTLVVRTILEDKTLRKELEGYQEYTHRVRHRLLPGIW
jgi:protein-S-isoprenylcysteine O-methyltransferase Ste14